MDHGGNRIKGWILGSAIVVALVVIRSFSVSHDNDPSADRDASPRDLEKKEHSSARGACLLRLREALHDPKSAEIDPTYSWPFEKTGESTYRTIISGRAKNAFGATRKGKWVCETQIVGSGVRVTRLEPL